ncbi:hypothetical protein Tco_1257793 [Tanacetum coccineum]
MESATKSESNDERRVIDQEVKQWGDYVDNKELYISMHGSDEVEQFVNESKGCQMDEIIHNESSLKDN